MGGLGRGDGLLNLYVVPAGTCLHEKPEQLPSRILGYATVDTSAVLEQLAELMFAPEPTLFLAARGSGRVCAVDTKRPLARAAKTGGRRSEPAHHHTAGLYT